MSNDITAWGSLKQSVALMWERKLAALGFVVVQAVLYGALSSLGLRDPGAVRDSLDFAGTLPMAGGTFVLSVVGMVVYLFYSHYMVTALRGEPVLVPARPLAAFLRLVWTVIKIGVVSTVLGGLIALPPAGLALGFPWLRETPAAIFGVVVYGFAAVFWLLLLSLRMELALPGAAVGDGVTLRRALRISKGRGWRLFLSVFLLMLLAALVIAAVSLPLFLISGMPSLVIATCAALTNGLVGLLGSTLLCVWYVRLSDGPAEGDEGPRVENLAEKIQEGYYAGGTGE